MAYEKTLARFVCPLCEQDDSDLLHHSRGGYAAFNRNVANFYICNGCGLVFRFPRPELSELLGSFYAVEYWKAKEIVCSDLYKTGYSSSIFLHAILDSIDEDLSNKFIIDMGCGFGSMVATLAEALPDTRIIGVEPDIQLAKMLQNCNRRNKVEIECGSLENLPEVVGVDVVFMMTVFEHLFDPVMALEKLHRWISSNGLLIINLPDVLEPGSLGLDYFFRDFHLFYYSDRTLSAMLRKAGFEVLAIKQGGVFKNSTAPTLCIIARKTSDRILMIDVDEADRIKSRIDSVRKRTKLSGPLYYTYKYKVRRKLFSIASKVKQSFTKIYPH